MIKIRKKQGKTKTTLYFDIFLNGERAWENTGLYLTGDKQHDIMVNKQVKILLAKRLSELYSSDFKISGWNGDFIKYTEESAKANPEYIRAINVIANLKSFRQSIKFSQIDEKFWVEFKEYLFKERKFAESTVYLVLKVLKSLLNKAVSDGVIPKNPLQSVKGKKVIVEKQYLTFEEITILDKSTCSNVMVKNAFLFSCFTGLRLSDIENLAWSGIREETIYITQQKTKRLNTIPIAKQAMKYLGEKGEDGIKVFRLPARSTLSIVLSQWIFSSGINKKITFHSARHTFATLSLTYNIDIMTVSKLLGHTDVKTTQIYAKIIESKKRDSIDKLPIIE